MTFLLALFSFTGFTQSDVKDLLKKVGDKIDKVNNYEASGTMKTNVTFLKVPESAVKIYFKKPNKLKIKNENTL